MSERVQLLWSKDVPGRSDMPLYGTPVADFMQQFKVAGVSMPAMHPALHDEDMCMPNSFSHYPMFEEVDDMHYMLHDDDGLPPWLLCFAALDPSQPQPAQADAEKPLSCLSCWTLNWLLGSTRI